MRRHTGDDKMSAFDAVVRADLVRLEEIRSARLQTSRATARKGIARETKIAPGTLENIKNMRTKGVRMWVALKIRDTLLSDLQREMARLQHEYDVLVRTGADPRCDEVAEVQTLLARARQSLEAVK